MSKKDSATGAKNDRLQIPVTKPQRDVLEAAAKAANASLNTWALARLMKAAGSADTEGAPIVVSGEVADRTRALAKAQDITVDKLLEQLLLGEDAPTDKPPDRRPLAGEQIERHRRRS